MSKRDNSNKVKKAKRLPCSGRERAEMLESMPWADGLDWRQVEILAAFMEGYEAAQGAVLVQEGDRSSHMCFIVSGSVHVVKDEPEGGTKRLATLGPGRTFGEMELVDAGPRSASVIAAQKTTFLVLDRRDFAALTDQKPRLALQILERIARTMSLRLRRTSGILSQYIEQIDT